MEKAQEKFYTLKHLIRGKLKRRPRVEFLIQFQDFLISEKIFELFGFPFLRRVETRRDKIRKIHTALAQVVGILMIILSVVSCIHFAEQNNLEATTENVCYIFTYLASFMFFYYILFYHRQTLTEVIEKLDEYYPHHGLDKHFHGVPKYFKELRIITRITGCCFIFSLLQFSAYVFELKIYGWITSQPTEWIQMHEFWFPFDPSEPFAYCIVHIIEIWSMFTMVLITLSCDVLYVSLIMLTSMEFDILAQKISEAETYDELKKLMKIHQELIEVTEKLQKVFSPLLLANVGTSISILCVAAFLATIGTNLFLLLKYCGGFFLAFAHGFVQCYFGQRIIDSSEAIGFAAYSIPWYGSDLRFQKLVLVIRMRANMPIKLTAWKFFDVSMETYYWILQTSHSFYSVLTGVHGAT